MIEVKDERRTNRTYKQIKDYAPGLYYGCIGSDPINNRHEGLFLVVEYDKLENDFDIELTKHAYLVSWIDNPFSGEKSWNGNTYATFIPFRATITFE